MIADTKILELFHLIVLWGLLIVCSKSLARDLGVIGKTYPIIEEDLIAVMQKRLQEKQKNGEISREMMALKEKSEKFIRRPLGIKLERAKVYNIRAITVSYRLSEDITDAEGRILYKAGTMINPLKIKTLSKAICFFDGDDIKQIEWINKTCGKNKLNKLIMTNGDFLDLSNKYQRRFYFDQKGVLATRLGIVALPAVVRQKGDLLYVEEFPIN